MQNLIYSEENVKKNHNVAIVSFTWLMGKIKMSVFSKNNLQNISILPRGKRRMFGKPTINKQ